MVLPSYYLPPISWFVRMLNSDEPILMEQCANYQKQTLHNRCWIDSPNGKLALTVPVDRSTFVQGKCLMKDVQVSYHQDWQKQHWYALESSYFNSPFFEYLQDDFRPIYNIRWKWLMDLNEELVGKCLELLNVDCNMSRTSEFAPKADVAQDFVPKDYYQVFKAKNGFIPDLSIVDLIFNMGPESILWVKKQKSLGVK